MSSVGGRRWYASSDEGCSETWTENLLLLALIKPVTLNYGGSVGRHFWASSVLDKPAYLSPLSGVFTQHKFSQRSSSFTCLASGINTLTVSNAQRGLESIRQECLLCSINQMIRFYTSIIITARSLKSLQCRTHTCNLQIEFFVNVPWWYISLACWGKMFIVMTSSSVCQTKHPHKVRGYKSAWNKNWPYLFC